MCVGSLISYKIIAMFYRIEYAKLHLRQGE